MVLLPCGIWLLAMLAAWFANRALQMLNVFCHSFDADDWDVRFSLHQHGVQANTCFFSDASGWTELILQSQDPSYALFLYGFFIGMLNKII